MKIAHFAPFAPGECGLFEAARDFVRADHHSGYKSRFIDTGPVRNNVRQPRQIGAKQIRGDMTLVTEDLLKVRDFDIFVLHDGIDMSLIEDTRAVIIKVLHGRPRYCYRQHQSGVNPIFDGYHSELENPRIKFWVTMWDEFVPFWEQVFPPDRLKCTVDPPIDQVIYKPDGIVHEIPEDKKGKYNILIADSWREDADPWEMAHGAILAGKEIEGLKIHVYGVPTPGPLGAWEYHFKNMRDLGIDGEVMARMPNMERVYRAMDLVLTSHKIATRIPAEAICCGTPVVGPHGARYTGYNCTPDDPESVAEAIKKMTEFIDRGQENVRNHVLETAGKFNLVDFGKKMTEIYELAIETSEVTPQV